MKYDILSQLINITIMVLTHFQILSAATVDEQTHLDVITQLMNHTAQTHEPFFIS